MVSAQKPSVIPSLSRDLGTASKEKIQRLSNRSAKILRRQKKLAPRRSRALARRLCFRSFLLPLQIKAEALIWVRRTGGADMETPPSRRNGASPV